MGATRGTTQRTPGRGESGRAEVVSESASESARRRVVASTAWEHGVPWVTFSVFDGAASDEVEDAPSE